MKATDVIDELYKMAGYLSKVHCEECGYNGNPLSDGRCPECGAMGGIKPKDVPWKDTDRTQYSRDESLSRLYDEIYSAKQDHYLAY